MANQFTYPISPPSSNETQWQYGLTYTLLWSSDWPSISLVLFQDFDLGGGESYYDLLLSP